MFMYCMIVDLVFFFPFFISGPPEDDVDCFTHELRGVIPRGFEYLFSLINREQEKVQLFL